MPRRRIASEISTGLTGRERTPKKRPPKKLTKRERDVKRAGAAVVSSGQRITREGLKTKRQAEGAVGRVVAQAKREEKARERAKARKAVAELRKMGIKIGGPGEVRGRDFTRRLMADLRTAAIHAPGGLAEQAKAIGGDLY